MQPWQYFVFVFLTGSILNIPIDEHLAFFLFFSTIASYNFIKYGLEAEKYILVANRYHKNIQFFSFIALGFCYISRLFFDQGNMDGIGYFGFFDRSICTTGTTKGQKLQKPWGLQGFSGCFGLGRINGNIAASGNRR